MRGQTSQEWGEGRAFSLVEVVLALGIISFCLMAVVGLLPVGLNLVKISREEAAAVKCLEQITSAIRGASQSSGTNRAWGAYSDLIWTTGGSAIDRTYTNLSMGGVPVAATLDQRLVARIQLTPPPNASSAGTALVSVAWPGHAEWNVAKTNWIQAQGSVSTWMIFLPQQ